MFVAACPLRISLFGGSTDNLYFVEKYGYGSVISFTCNLKTYVSLHQDKFGYNMQGRKYIVNYSKREETDYINDIQNDLVRTVLNYFKCLPLTVSMTSDAYSQGSGLASSSSYTIGLIKCMSLFNNLNLTDIEICSLAHQLELNFNPYCGYQDPYGCGIGGFKRIHFERGGIIKYNFLPTNFFKQYDIHLIFTNITRNSKIILKDVSNNIDKAVPLIEMVELAYAALISNKYDTFLYYLNKSWIQKKEISGKIIESTIIKDIDVELSTNKTVLAHKLCGAGNGGFFLTISRPRSLKIPYDSIKIDIETDGVTGEKL